MIVRVYHDYYGCDTGCCGHTVEITDAPDGKEHRRFEFFDGPFSTDDLKAWARAIAEETIRKNWPECLDSIDWDTLDVSEVRRGC